MGGKQNDPRMTLIYFIPRSNYFPMHLVGIILKKLILITFEARNIYLLDMVCLMRQCCKYLPTLLTKVKVGANSVDPYQNDRVAADGSWSTWCHQEVSKTFQQTTKKGLLLCLAL